MWNFFGNVCERIKENMENMIDEDGYPWEEHEVTTEDGYINSMYRIPYSKKRKTNNNEKRPPVILGHGMTCSSAVFLNECRLAYYLADEGFDVWLPNNRGTTFSRKHVTLDSEKDKDKYWNFSWHEIGVYDIPAFVDYVIEKTGFEKVHYVGHSQGTTAFAVLASERPEYNDKIVLSCLLGSAIAVDFKITTFSLGFLIYIFVPFYMMIDTYLVKLHELPLTYISRAFSALTHWTSLTRYITLLFMFGMAGHADFDQVTEFDLKKFSQTTPNSSSIRQMFHYKQVMNNKRFAKYDHGPQKNLEKYGSKEPPEYDLFKVTSPVALFYGKNDMYNDPRRDRLNEKMSNVVYIHIAEHDQFNHLDFLVAKDSVSQVYRHMVKIMKKYKSVCS